MPESNNIGKRCEDIQLLIASDSIKEAIKLLLDFVRDFSEDKSNLNEVIVISATYNRLEKTERRGTLNYDTIEAKRSRLLYQMLGLLDDIEEDLALKMKMAS